jgi:hypothetical protein
MLEGLLGKIYLGLSAGLPHCIFEVMCWGKSRVKITNSSFGNYVLEENIIRFLEYEFVIHRAKAVAVITFFGFFDYLTCCTGLKLLVVVPLIFLCLLFQ